MGLTAREWLLLPETEQKKRGTELSSEECFKLRTELSMIHFTEEEKDKMSEEEKDKFVYPSAISSEEKETFNKKAKEIFKKMQDEVVNK